VLLISVRFVRLYFSDPAFFLTDMTDFLEQRICIKFSFNLKKKCFGIPPNATEAFGDKAMSQSKIWFGTNASRMDELLSTTMSVLDDRRQAQHQII